MQQFILGPHARDHKRHSRTSASHLVSRRQILQACSFCLCPCQTPGALASSARSLPANRPPVTLAVSVVPRRLRHLPAAAAAMLLLANCRLLLSPHMHILNPISSRRFLVFCHPNHLHILLPLIRTRTHDFMYSWVNSVHSLHRPPPIRLFLWPPAFSFPLAIQRAAASHTAGLDSAASRRGGEGRKWQLSAATCRSMRCVQLPGQHFALSLCELGCFSVCAKWADEAACETDTHDAVERAAALEPAMRSEMRDACVRGFTFNRVSRCLSPSPRPIKPSQPIHTLANLGGRYCGEQLQWSSSDKRLQRHFAFASMFRSARDVRSGTDCFDSVEQPNHH